MRKAVSFIFIAALMLLAVPIVHAQGQVDTTKQLNDFQGSWDGFYCAENKTDAWRLEIHGGTATLTEADNLTHPFFSTKLTVEGGILDVVFSNGPDAENPGTVELVLAYNTAHPGGIMGQSGITFADGHGGGGGNFTAAVRTKPGQSLSDFAAEFKNECAQP